MKLLLPLLFIIGFSMSATADPVRIETDSFVFEMPEGWKIIELSSQAKIVGPNDEYLIVSSYRIDGGGKESDLEAIKEEFAIKIWF